MKLAEKFNSPIITLIDTSGAYPGIEAEEHGQQKQLQKLTGNVYHKSTNYFYSNR
jgi:acetyl-CoA carboxylase alpha subunit